MVLLLVGLLFILNTTALTFLCIAYCTNRQKLLRTVLFLTAINILVNALIFVILY